MRTTQTLIGEKARAAITKGVNAIYGTAGRTLGPNGKNALLYRSFNRGSRITNDGYTVAEVQEPKDIFVRLAAQTFKESCKRTNEKVGDGPQDLNSRILTPKGWVRMGDIKVNDEICGTNGTFQRVIGVFPKGKLEKYKVYFSGNGVVTCCKNHMWTVSGHGMKKQTLPLASLISDYEKLNKDNTVSHKYYVGTTVAEFKEQGELMSVDPYLLGLLLGDGSLTGKGKSYIELSLGKLKKHVLDKIILPDGLKLKIDYISAKNYYRVKIQGRTPDGKSMKDLIMDFGLLGVRSDKKFIPIPYLFSSVDSRKKLLQGLIDTDAHVNERGLFEFLSTSRKLADDFADLCRSLGKQISIREKNRVGGGGYSENTVFCVSERKGYKYGNKIIKIESTGELVDMQCIKVSNFDNLYITDDYVLTHNTTTTVVIGGSLYKAVDRILNEANSSFGGTGVNVMALKRKILESAEKVKERIKGIAKKISTLEELENVAIISVEDEKLGKTIAKMAWEVGVDGFIDIVEGYKNEIETEVIKGMRFPAKVAAKGFLNNPAKYEMAAQDCAVLVTNYKLDSAGQVADAIGPLLKENPKIILIAPEFSQEVLTEMWKSMFAIDQQGNKVKKPGVDFFPVHTPSLRTEQFEDLATYCGARFIDKAKGAKLKNITAQDLGFLEKLVVKDSEAKEDATAVGGKGMRDEKTQTFEEIENEGKKKKVFKDRITTAVKDRIETLRGQLEETKEPQFKKLIERRIASMSSAIGIIRVGDSTQASSLYWKLKIEDGVYACKAALRGGYVKGGGLCLKEIADDMADDDILKPALLAPYNQIQANGALPITENIIDPTETVYYSVEHATQVVANLITVDIITQEAEDPIHGEGEIAIARAIGELVLNDRIHKGQLKESEREAARDNQYRMLTDENLSTDELVELSGHDDFAV